MAQYLASIYGTEQDKVNCSFYYKIGACRHGDRCSRKHTKPPFSQTILIANVYQNPRHADPDCKLTDEELQAQFDDFFEDFFCELAKYGNLLEMHVCDNVGDHLIGNVYARYDWEEEAQRAVDGLNDRWYAGRPLFAELSPVTDFREACCRQNETNECNRGGFCNFMHLRYASAPLVRELHHQLSVEQKERKRKEKEEKARRKGWKEELREVEGVDAADSGDGRSWKKGASGGDWRSGRSGGDWRSGPSALDAEGDANDAAMRDQYAGENRPTGADGPGAGSAAEYESEARRDGGHERAEHEHDRDRDLDRSKDGEARRRSASPPARRGRDE